MKYLSLTLNKYFCWNNQCATNFFHTFNKCDLPCVVQKKQLFNLLSGQLLASSLLALNSSALFFFERLLFCCLFTKSEHCIIQSCEDVVRPLYSFLCNRFCLFTLNWLFTFQVIFCNSSQEQLSHSLLYLKVTPNSCIPLFKNCQCSPKLEILP